MATRRQVVLGAAAAVAGSLLPRSASALATTGGTSLDFTAAERSARLLGPDGPASSVWTYGNDLLPVHRVARGERVRVTLHNRLPQHTTVHWHGIRVPNAMDGVQYVTQPPVEPGESFSYEFEPPDTGTFFFHPHCNESGQTGRGLAGVVLVEGDEEVAPDHEVTLIAKDWRLNPDGTYMPFVTDQGAGTAGTFGTIRSVNTVPVVRAKVPAVADVRIRLLNLDSTRIMDVGVEGGEASVIAIDGNPVVPFALDTWRIGPAMRVDVMVRTPGAPGTVRVVDYAPKEPYRLAELEAEGVARKSRSFVAHPLIPASIPDPELNGAERQTYTFGPASAELAAYVDSLGDDPLRGAVLDALCVGSRTFWAINKHSWPAGAHRDVPPPLAALKDGRSYIFTLQNATPHAHPIHLHGHTFRVLSSSRRHLPVHHADTVLLAPKERVEIAFVARRGNWMFHCHILDHQETGMMGYLQVA